LLGGEVVTEGVTVDGRLDAGMFANSNGDPSEYSMRGIEEEISEPFKSLLTHICKPCMFCAVTHVSFKQSILTWLGYLYLFRLVSV